MGERAKNGVMTESKGKPSGKYAEARTSAGRKGDYKRAGWPEDAPTQRVEHPKSKRLGLTDGRGRNRKAGSPV
jgi:hypothetical protein